MAVFDDDNDPTAGSQDEDDNEDEEMEDMNDADQDADQDMDQGGDDEDDEDDNDNDDNDNDDDDDDDDQNEPDSPSRRPAQHDATHRPSSQGRSDHPAVVLTSPSPHISTARSPGAAVVASWIPPTREIALNAQVYDIVPTMAAPQSTSINAVAATPDMRWVFSGGTDGYVRMFNWVETANGKVPLTVAQKHPFVDSVMKAGSLLTYWENEETLLRTPPSQSDEGKWTSPVYSLAVQHEALWLFSGLESGSINLQTCRHQAGTRITTLKEHTSAVSVLALSQDETSLLSGSWDKTIHDWDLHTGRVKRSFRGSGSQISTIETRPLSDVAVPEVVETPPGELNGTFSSNNASKSLLDSAFSYDYDINGSKIGGGEEDALGSPGGSLFGEDHGSLFGEDMGGGGGGGNVFGDDDDELTGALEREMQDVEQDAPGEADAEMAGMGQGGPVQPPEGDVPDLSFKTLSEDRSNHEPEAAAENGTKDDAAGGSGSLLANGLPHGEGPLTAPPSNDEPKASASDLPVQSESTFLDAAIDGTLRIWDRRMATPIATIVPSRGTPPWCTGACWSPDGNFFYAGRRQNTVDEYSIHHLGRKRSEPNRVFKFPQGSGAVYAVRAMPNKKHLVCASNDILRIYDLAQSDTRKQPVPFTIVPGHRGGVISSIYIDPSCHFMLSASGNRGWEGSGTEVLLGYEIGVQDEKGVWHK